MTTSWRDVLKIHPAAELFPAMSAEELRALGEDIRKNGMVNPIIYWSDDRADADHEWYLLDGCNRLDAMELVGMQLVKRGRIDNDLLNWGRVSPGPPSSDKPAPDPYAFAVSVNINRRHLTTAQKGELIEKLLKAKPEQSDGAIAKQVKADPKTVGAHRAKLEATQEIPETEKRTGADGRTRKKPARKVQMFPLPEPPPAPPRTAAGVLNELGVRIARLSNLEANKEAVPILLRIDKALAKYVRSRGNPVQRSKSRVTLTNAWRKLPVGLRDQCLEAAREKGCADQFAAIVGEAGKAEPAPIATTDAPAAAAAAPIQTTDDSGDPVPAYKPVEPVTYTPPPPPITAPTPAPAPALPPPEQAPPVMRTLDRVKPELRGMAKALGLLPKETGDATDEVDLDHTHDGCLRLDRLEAEWDPEAAADCICRVMESALKAPNAPQIQARDQMQELIDE